MKIAIATNDRKTIAKRTGRAAEFAIYHIENGEIISIDHQKNSHTHHDNQDRNEGNHRQGFGEGHKKKHLHKHGKGECKEHGEKNHHEHKHEHAEHSHDEIINQLKGVDLLLVRAVGKYMKKDLENANITYQLAKNEFISDTIDNYLNK